MAATLDFPLEEYRERLTRLRQYLKESGLDGLLVTTEITHRYLSGHRSRRWINVNSPMASIYTSTGDALIVCDRFEENQVAATSWISHVYSYPPLAARIDSFMKQIRESLTTVGLDRGRIGAELGIMQRLGIPLVDFEWLRSSLPNAVFVDASEILWRLRSIKSRRELEAMREANALTDAAREQVYANLEPPKTEFGITQAMYAELARLGSEPGGYVVARHMDTPIPQVERVFQPGDILYIDAGAVVRGCVADCCRSVALNRVSDQRREGFRMLWDVQQEALRPVKAGESVRTVIDAYEAELRRLDKIHSDFRWGSLSGFIGHGIGMNAGEPPMLVEGEGDVVLEEGMTLMIEPSFGWREDLYINEEPIVVTSNGYDLLGVIAPREIRIV
jgi:Xaa-Pro aminopeptidase